ncbi:MAG: glutamyl-tRNA reductase [Anaerolineales bacterium]
MSIFCIGVNNQTAPISLRERLALSEAQMRASLARCGCGDREVRGPNSELILLSTCNRVEMYAISSSNRFEDSEELLAEITGVAREEFAPHLYRYRDLAAARHLFSVAAGLDSMVLGEPQILGQVAESYTLALSIGSTGLILSRLFQCAIHAAKRAHHETDISTNPATVSSVAVHLIASVVRPLNEAHVLMVGAGEMAEMAVEALRKRGVSDITVVNRTVARARLLADRWHAQARGFESLEEQLVKSDVVISSTSAPHAIFRRDNVKKAMEHRPSRPLIMMDIAVPRDIDGDVRDLELVYLYDIDQLQDHLTHSVEGRKAEVPKVEAILAEELRDFEDWYQRLAIRPVIKAIHQQAEEIRSRQVEKALRRLSNLNVEAQEQIETLTKALVKKLLHEPTSCLKEQSRNGQAAEYALYARELFGLDGKSLLEGDGE